MRLLEENWESQQLAEFVVAPLKEHDAILGMPFLADEGILIDPAQRKIVLPQSQPAVETEPTSSSLRENCDVPDIPSLGGDTTDLRKEEEVVDFLEPSFRSI